MVLRYLRPAAGCFSHNSMTRPASAERFSTSKSIKIWATCFSTVRLLKWRMTAISELRLPYNNHSNT